MSKGRASSLRSFQTFKRKEGTREAKKTILIVCEGETEEKYFKNLKGILGLTNATIFVAGSGGDSAPINLVRKAETIYADDRGYDFIFCVFDRDQHSTFCAARERIKQLASRSKRALPICEAVSVPSFELWVLLHYEKTDRSFSGAQEIQEYLVRSGHISRYSKGDDVLSKLLISRLEPALINAKWLEDRKGIADENPMTNVHHMIHVVRSL